MIWCSLFGHADLIRDRDDQDRYILRCQRCEMVIPVLTSKVETEGPKHQPSEVLGRPKTVTFRETKFGQRKIVG